jgi:endonuclease G
MKRLWLILFYSLLCSQDLRPKPISGEQIINHSAYSLSYNERSEQASWVAYELTASEVKGTIGRTDNFRIDPYVSTGSASLSDYKGSGYDRGHLAPAGDMKWSSTAMSVSFYMSNMSPQNPSFNRGIWKRLENQVRQWAVDNGSVYIATAGVLNGSLTTIGSNRVAVPLYYYKVVLDYREPELKGIGFILPNRKGENNLKSYAITINQVESITGIDFFHNLPDEIEEKIEGAIDLSKWSFKPYKGSSDGGTATQCLGTTQKGNRCGNRTNNTSGYCYLHGTSKITKSSKRVTSVRCMGITKKGARCKRKTKSSNGYCYQHGGK